jgi:hypothetical protein
LAAGGNGGNGGGGGGAIGTTTGGAGLNAGSAGGGGAANTQANAPGGNGGANTGGGGGGGSHYNATNAGGNGGSGIVIVRYLGSQNATGGTVTTSGLYTVHTFTSSGTFTPTSPWIVMTDLTKNINDGAFINGPTFSSSNGGSISFDGTNDYIALSVNSTTTLIGSTTISCWAKFNSFGTNGHAELFITGGGNRAGIFATATYIGMYSEPDGFYTVNVATTISTGTWYNITGVIDRSGTIFSVYINGRYIGQDTFTSYTPSATQVRIGAINITGNTGDYMNGNLAITKIYNRILSADEILQNFNALRGRFGL